MHFLDDESNKKLDNVTILLTEEKLRKLIGYAFQLIRKLSASILT